MSSTKFAPEYAPGLHEGKVSHWEELPDFRWITSLGRLRQGIMTLQRAWRCREDGRIEWRCIPMQVISEEEYSHEVAENAMRSSL